MVFSGAVLLALVGCAGDSPAPEPESVAQEESAIEVEGQESGGNETTMPSGARPASDSFPFPVPEDWAELHPFTEEKIGASMAMVATYEFPGDAKSAAALYEQLLKSGGFEAYPYAPGELVNDASLMVEGTVSGEDYKGGIDFDTTAEGTQRASIHLQEN